MSKRNSLGALAVVAFAFAVAAPTRLVAQDDAAELKEVVQLSARGKNDEALVKLNAILAKDMPSERALELRNSLESEQWVRLQIQSDKMGAAVTALFDRAMPAARAKTGDVDAIKKTLEDLRNGDWAAQQKALLALASSHGEYASAQLAAELGVQDTDKRTRTMEWLRKLTSSNSTMPLIQALKGEDKIAVSSAATVLGMLRDARAVPYLAWSAGAKRDPMIVEASMKALGGAKINVSEALLALAEQYYRRDPAVVDSYRTVYPVWNWKDGALVAREVPRDIYHLKLAEGALFDLLAVEPGNEGAHVLMTSVLLAEAEAGRGMTGDADKEVAAALAQARVLAGTASPATLDKVIAKALADGRSDVAEAAVQILGNTLNADTFASPNGLTMGVASSFKAVRFAAALALAHINPRGGFEGRDLVVPALAEALGQDAVRNVLVIDDNAVTRNQMIADINAKHYFAYGTDNGAIGVSRLREYPIEDAVIVRYNLTTTNVSEVVRAVRGDARTEKTPIFLLVEKGDAEAAKTQYGDKVQGMINTPPVAGAYEPALAEQTKIADAAREAATLTAAAAARALAMMDPKGSGFSSAGALGALVASLTGDDRVRLSSIDAVGAIGDASANAGLIDVVKTAGASDAIRGHAIVALARIARATGSLAPEVGATMHEASTAGGSVEFMTMLGQAAGIAPLSDVSRARLLGANRAKVMIDLVK